MTIEVKELRGAERYVFASPVTASYGSFEIRIVNLSESGLQALHAMPMRIGSSSRIWFRFGDVTAAATGRLLWCHLSKEADTNGKTLYRSGIRIEDPAFAEAVRELVAKGHVRVDAESLDRKRKALIEKERRKSGPVFKVVSVESGISADQLLLIKHARERLKANPTEALRLYEQARTAEVPAGTSKEVLAVWEYLERTITLPLIARAFEA